jgi:hypothetical protein
MSLIVQQAGKGGAASTPGNLTSLRLAQVLSAIVAVLAAVAALGGMFGGIYRDNALILTAWKGNDLVTLVVAVPLLVATLVGARRGSDRALLVWLGAVGYMLYNYLFYLFGAAFNVFFLLYVLLVALSLYAFVLGLASLDAGKIGGEFRAGTPVKWISGLMLLIPLIMGGIELARAVGFIFTGEVPADIVQTGHPTGVVYAMDLALLMPAIVVAAVLLWQRRPWGYVLATVLMVKGLTYPLVLVAMSVLGTWDPLTPVYAFFWVLSSVAMGLLLVNMRQAGERGGVVHRSGGGVSAVTR